MILQAGMMQIPFTAFFISSHEQQLPLRRPGGSQNIKPVKAAMITRGRDRYPRWAAKPPMIRIVSPSKNVPITSAQ